MPSPRLLEHLRREEGCVLHPYPDQVGLPTIGYGHRIPSMDHPALTQGEADALLARDAGIAERKALQLAPNLAAHPGPLDALTDLIFNAGAGALPGTNTLKFLREGRWAEAAERFLLWNKARAPNGALIELPELTRRRKIGAGWIREG